MLKRYRLLFCEREAKMGIAKSGATLRTREARRPAGRRPAHYLAFRPDYKREHSSNRVVEQDCAVGGQM